MFNPNAGEKTPLQIMERRSRGAAKRYADAGYGYDAVMAMYSHDFVEPTNVREPGARRQAVEMNITTRQS